MDFLVPRDGAQNGHTWVGVFPMPLAVFSNKSGGGYHVIVGEEYQFSPGFFYGQVASRRGAAMLLPQVTNRHRRRFRDLGNDRRGLVSGSIVNHKNLSNPLQCGLLQVGFQRPLQNHPSILSWNDHTEHFSNPMRLACVTAYNRSVKPFQAMSKPVHVSELLHKGVDIVRNGRDLPVKGSNPLERRSF